MTSYRLFPSTSGPGSANAYSGDFISGVVFSVAGDNCWFEGYWWWVAASGQSTSPVKCALWAPTSATTGEVVAGSVVTSGTLTAGQWNWIPLATPVQLARGYTVNGATSMTSCYVAAVGVNGAFPDTNGFWSAPIDNTLLHAYEFANATGGTGSPPLNLPQGCFSTAGTDPSVTMPNEASGTDNFWVDVQVADTAPGGYAGGFRLWPNKSEANAITSGDAAVDYTVATEIHLSEECTLNNVWYYSPSGATTLATRCDVWNIGTGLSVASITSPAWTTDTGAAFTAGTTPHGGSGTWIKAAFAGGLTLPAGSYRVSVFNASGTSDANWSPKDAGTDYWGESGSGGVGASGLNWGPLYAPGWSAASSGYDYNAANGGASPPYAGSAEAHAQPPFGMNPGGTVQFPQLYAVVNSDQTQNYWVDLEVTPYQAPVQPSTYALQAPGHVGAALSLTAPASSGDRTPTGSGVGLLVWNSGTGTATVTLPVAALWDARLSVQSRTVQVPPGITVIAIPDAVYGAATTPVDYSSTAGVEVAAVVIPGG